MMMHIATTLLLLAVPIVWAAAQPKVGDTAPEFELSSLQGKTVRLSDVRKAGTVVLVALRGYPGYQCPLCNRQVQEFIRNAQRFAEAGTRVVMVYPGPAQRASEFVADKKLPANFDLVLDPEYAFTNRYGLRWEAAGETAYPSTLVINSEGVISFAKISTSHGGRASAAEILDVLAKNKSRR
jgi:peroxiredoxin